MKISVVSPTIRPEGLKIVQESLETQTFQDFEWLVEVGLRNIKGSDLNKAYNRMLRRAKGELVVSIQDYIKVPENALQGFWEAYEKEKAFYTAPVCNDGEWDWRKTRERECGWQEWEIDFGSAPLEYLKEIGGFNENLDKHWGFDNVHVGYKAHQRGWKFYNLPHIQAETVPHEKNHAHRAKRDADFHNKELKRLSRHLDRLE